jgi:LemA protein
MKTRTWIIIGAIVVFIFILYRLFAGTYNKLVTYEETVSTQWSQVQNVYQRRMDLIPNLVNTVKGYADFEKSTLTAVIDARAKATQVTVDPSKLSTEEIAKFQQSQGALSSALGRLMVVVEKYPELKANQNFLELQSQLEGTENRITVERGKFNETAKQYNTYLRSFPNNIFGGMYGFQKKGYFEATTGAEKAPEVKF